MKRLFTTIMLCCICALVGLCGINKTLNEAQSLFQGASTISQYQAAKKKFQSAKYDVGYVAAEHDNAINEGVRKCDRKINELSPRLTVNGNSSSTDISFSASGGSKTLTISTNQGVPNASALPSWITVSNSSTSSLSIYCSANTSTSSRNDWFNVNAGSRTVRVNVSQSGKIASSSSSNSSSSQNTPNGNHSANIESVWIEQNVTSGGQLGINVHVKFTVAGLNGKEGKVSTYYYDSSNNAIRDTNGSYCTSGDNPVVATSGDFKPGYDNSRYDDFKVFIPYSELHQSGTAPRTINVTAIIWDYSTSDHKQLARKANTTFSFTPKSDSYLKVDSKTAVSTSFSASGGTETFYISTDADSWSTWGVPSFCEVTNKTSTSFTLKCNPNSGSERSDYMKVKTGNHEVRIDITQASGSGAKINRIWVDHNTFNGGQKGMMIHIDFEVNGLKNHTINPVAYFEYSNGNRLNDYDGYYRTTDGQVSIGDSSNADYDGTRWSDFKLFMPYNQLHMGTGSYSLQFHIHIHDKTTGKVLLRSDNQGFTFSR